MIEQTEAERLKAESQLRDWFAGQALVGQLAHAGWNVPEDAAKWAYEMADSMMKERAR